ncbi:MAG: Era-like GTP-binding protein [Candidatus Anstonellaceae archaeon]
MIKRLLNWIRRIFGGKKSLTLGIYGSPNVGKTTLANRICVELAGEPIGTISPIPHETRVVQQKEKIMLKIDGFSITMNVLDMPGIAVKVDYRDFLEYGLSKEEAQKRAREATRGVVEAVRHLDKVDAALLMVDSTEDPYTQVNITILGNMEARKIPIIVVANKIDLPGANVARVKEAFSGYDVVEISAKTGENLKTLYKEIASKLA